jgi:lysophospholipase L1-like esterase
VTHFRKIWLLAAAFAAAVASSGPAPADPPMTDGSAAITPSCATPASLSAIDAPLDRTASRIQAGQPLTIVAMGSSSTQGVGASATAMSYPSRLEQELRDRFPSVEMRVINRGVGGQDVGEELARLDRDVIAEHPDLVIWQVGTNAALRRDDLSADEQLILRGIAVIKERGIDVVLMDLQYAPRVLERRASAQMERLIVEIIHRTHVGLFRRFEIMQEWDHTHQLAPAAMIGPDGLHMTDASYGCLASQLAEALAWNWWSHAKLAKSPNRSPDAIAGVERSPGAQSIGPSRQR